MVGRQIEPRPGFSGEQPGLDLSREGDLIGRREQRIPAGLRAVELDEVDRLRFLVDVVRQGVGVVRLVEAGPVASSGASADSATTFRLSVAD